MTAMSRDHGGSGDLRAQHCCAVGFLPQAGLSFAYCMPVYTSKARSAAAMAELKDLREEFRARMATAKRPVAFSSRVGVVLSGGGARGAYEAGVLLAFQDAQVPTHIIASTSIGSINAASYAGHSDSFVGKAESLVESWSELTPATVGIDWLRYILVLIGQIGM